MQTHGATEAWQTHGATEAWQTHGATEAWQTQTARVRGAARVDAPPTAAWQHTHSSHAGSIMPPPREHASLAQQHSSHCPPHSPQRLTCPS